jgi:CheY-like chemotaxis protein
LPVGVIAPEPTMPYAESSVLYVDHRLIDLLLMKVAIRRRPHLTLQVAFNGTQALRLAPTLKPAALLIGMDLPDGSSAELLRELRRIPGCADAPAVALTADGHSEALSAGFDELWSKPLNLEAIGARLDRLCRSAGTMAARAPLQRDDAGWPSTHGDIQPPLWPARPATAHAQEGW